MRKLLILSAFLFAAILSIQPARAQVQRRAITPQDTLQYFRMLPNGNAYFQIYAPKAITVQLAGDVVPYGKPGAVISKEHSNGVWSFEIIDPEPGVFRYRYIIDGLTVYDPKNPDVNQNAPLAVIAPKGDEFFAYNPDIQHGAMAVRSYYSKTAQTVRTMRVWTPAGYEKSKEKLPVLYLVHGGGDTDTAWPGTGAAGDILDNLLAQGKMERMIVVMPNGTFPGDEVPIFAQDMVTDIIPFIENNYRVIADQAHRAMAGLSMGGIETLEVTFNNPNLFSYVWVLSASFQPSNDPKAEAERLGCASKIPTINKTVKEFVFTQGGETDIAYKNGINTRTVLEELGLKFEYMEVPGGHSFVAWRQNLYDLAQRVFK